MRHAALLSIGATLAISTTVMLPSSARDTGADRVLVDISKLSSQQQQSLMQELGTSELEARDEGILVDRPDLVEAIKSLQGRSPRAWPSLSVESDIDFGAIDAFRSRVQQVYSPSESSRQIREKIFDIRLQCAGRHTAEAQRDSCFSENNGPAYQAVLDELAAGGAGCEQAAIDYRSFLHTCKQNCAHQGQPIKRRFDNACMSSNLPWQREDGLFRADPEPSAFRVGGNRNGAAGILDAVMLIELDEQGHRQHLCGGLLLSRNRVLTAQHCFLTTYAQIGLNEGWAYVRRPGSGPNQRYRLLGSDAITRTRMNPAQDYVVLEFEADEVLPSPRVVFSPVTQPTRTVVYGYFGDFDSDRVLAGSETSAGVSDIPTWKQGMRWAKPGLCHAMETLNGCVRTLCQTVGGYSGAPIFDERSSPDEPLIVYGVISQANHPNTQCGNVDSFTTLAASASDVAP